MNRLLAAIAWRYLNESMWAWAAERDADMATSPGDAHEHNERAARHIDRAALIAYTMEQGHEHGELRRLQGMLHELDSEEQGAYSQIMTEMRRLKKIADEPPF